MIWAVLGIDYLLVVGGLSLESVLELEGAAYAFGVLILFYYSP